MDKELKVRISIDSKTGTVNVLGTEFTNLNQKIKQTDSSANSLEQTLLKYVKIGTVIYGVKQAFDIAKGSVTEFISKADDMSMVNSRLSLVTKSTEEYTRAQTELLSISNGARVAVRGTSDLYAQLTRSTESLGTSQKDLLQVTDTISKTLTISGASATAAEASLLQLSQGFASGALRGEELNSVMEQTPRLAQAIANGMGVSIGQLRTMGAEGKLTAEVVMAALLSQSQIINEEFSKIAINASSGYSVLNNTIDTTVAKIDGQYKVTQTVGQLYIAVGQTIDTIFTQMSAGWGNSTDSTLVFANAMSSTVIGFIQGIGYAYDVLETIGAEFNVLRYAGEAAFYAIQVVSSNVASGIITTFEGAFNTVIDGINSIIDYINSLGFISLPFIGSVDFGGARAQARVSYTEDKFSQALNNLTNAAVDFTQSGKGQEWADIISTTFKSKFDELIAQSQEAALNSNNSSSSQNSVVSSNADIFTDVKNLYEDYKNNTSNTNNTDSSNINAYEDYKKQIEEALNSLNTTTSSLSDTTDALDTLNTTLGEDGTYTVVKDTTSSVDTLNNSLEDVTTSADKAADIFFAFSDTLLNSLTSNADSLLSVVTNSSNIIEISYSAALANMEAVKQELIANPLDKDIGQKYADAFSQLQNSSSTFLNKDNFTTKSGYDFAVATVSTQLGQYQNTAAAGYSVLDSMNSFLESINTAFEDGILTEEEKKTISDVADTVNAKNDILLGNNGAVVGAVNNQEYYNNIGLATDSTVNTLYKGQNIGTTVTNQISGFATDGAINNNANTVSSVVASLRGGQSTGISLSGIVGTLPSLAVSTGLDVSQLSNLSLIKSATQGTNTATNYMTSGNTTALKNLQIKSLTYTYNYSAFVKDSSGSGGRNIVTTTPGMYYSAENVQNLGVASERYTYYSEGGFTGLGYGVIDQTGYKQAGIVHEGEWVAPKWMLYENPVVFAQLEAIRKNGSFAAGGYTSTATNFSINNSSNKQLEQNTKDIKELIKNNILLTRDIYNLFARLTNNGQSMLVEINEQTTIEVA